MSCSKDDPLPEYFGNEKMIIGTWQLTSEGKTSKYLKFGSDNFYQRNDLRSEVEYSEKIKYVIKGDTIIYSDGSKWEHYYLIRSVSKTQLKIQMAGEILGNIPIYEYRKL